jgi:hypothetical protein
LAWFEVCYLLPHTKRFLAWFEVCDLLPYTRRFLAWYLIYGLRFVIFFNVYLAHDVTPTVVVDDLNPVHVHSLIMLSIDYVTWSSSETNAFFVIILLIILVFSMRRLVPDHSYQQCPAGVLAATTIPFTLHLVGISDSEFYRLKTVLAELVMVNTSSSTY